MKKRRYGGKRRQPLQTKYILFILTAVCIAGIFSGLLLNVSGGPLKTVAGYVFVPMQSGLNKLGQWGSDKINNFKTLSDVVAENEELQKQVDELTSNLTTARLESYEVTNLRELLKLDETYPSYDKVAANIVARDSNNWFSVFTIDRGSDSGIKVGMNVIAGSGLVGIVTDVSKNFATVRSIIDDSSNVSASIATSGDIFNVSGSLKSMNEEQVIQFSELRDEENKVATGDPVVTSHVSDLYQPGILIGYINSVKLNSNNLTKSGTVTPVVDFEHLQFVMVILNVKETSE